MEVRVDDNLSRVFLLNKKEFNKYLGNKDNNKLNSINEVLELNTDIEDQNTFYLVSNEADNDLNIINSSYTNHNINIAIASAITAQARIYMSKFKNNPNLTLYYTDTDSIFTDLNPDEMNFLFQADFPEDIVNKDELGALKLENKINRAIFLLAKPTKAYILETEDGDKIVKVKGLKSTKDITFDQFKSLLIKDSELDIQQEKWFKHLNEGSIEVLVHSYNIKLNGNKRDLIYNKDDVLIGTEPKELPENSPVRAD